MKLFACSDAHADFSTAGSPRFEDVARAMRAVAQAAVDARADAFLFLGDLADPDTGPPTLAAASLSIELALFLSSRGVENHWLAGNHDVVEDGSGQTTLSPLRRVADLVPGIHVHEHPRVVWCLKKRLRVVALPFAASSHGYDPAEFVRGSAVAEAEVPTVVLGHLNIDGMIPGSETAEMPRGRSVRFPVEAIDEVLPRALILHGHYHRGQQVGRVHIPGSLVRLTFAEEDHEPGYLVVDVPEVPRD